MLYCLDSYNGEGIMGKSGTSSAAMILRDELCGQHNSYEKLFSPQRMNFRAGIGNLFTDLGESVRVTDQGLMHTGNFWIIRLRKIFNKTVL